LIVCRPKTPPGDSDDTKAPQSSDVASSGDVAQSNVLYADLDFAEFQAARWVSQLFSKSIAFLI